MDLIFTDPLYSERDLYTLLAQVALRVLKPGGAVLCWSNGKWHRQNTNWLEAAGLTYRWDFACIHHAGAAPMNGRIISKTNRLIWLDKGATSKMLSYFVDGYLSMPWGGPKEHKWTKNPIFSEQAMNAFSSSSAIVFDPYCGGGTTPAIAKITGRNYIAFEIDPATAERARERVANTQPMHPAFLAEQHGLDLEAA